jgi:ferredoxin
VTGKPTAPFFPQSQPLFGVAPGPAQPLLVAGLTAADCAALRFVDRFFASGWRDERYCERRAGARLLGVAGACGADGALLPLCGDACDLELVCHDGAWHLLARSPAGAELAQRCTAAAAPGSAAELQRHYGRLGEDAATELIAQAAALLASVEPPDTFWEEIAERCIACTGCNLVCPTCTCFGVQDWRYPQAVERSRMWDSCQLDGFMREASGHNPLGTQALRTRRRIHHKLAADPQRWGEISCVACGRCDAACPTGIGMLAVARELVARYR